MATGLEADEEIFRKSAAEGLGHMGHEGLRYLPQLLEVLTDRGGPQSRSSEIYHGIFIYTYYRKKNNYAYNVYLNNTKPLINIYIYL